MATTLFPLKNINRDFISPPAIYDFEMPIEKIGKEIQKNFDPFPSRGFWDGEGTMTIFRASGFSCNALITYTFKLKDLEDQTRLVLLNSTSEECRILAPRRVLEDEAQQIFEEKFVKKLHNILEAGNKAESN